MKSILIVYGTYAGSTAEVASAIKTTLGNLTCQVDLRPASADVIDLNPYDLIIIGSAIHGGRPHETVSRFIALNGDSLSQKPIAVFTVCATITSSIEKRRTHALTYPATVAGSLQPVATAIFGGIAGSSGRFVNWLGKQIMGVTPGDYRDWEQIRAWATRLATAS